MQPGRTLWRLRPRRMWGKKVRAYGSRADIEWAESFNLVADVDDAERVAIHTWGEGQAAIIFKHEGKGQSFGLYLTEAQLDHLVKMRLERAGDVDPEFPLSYYWDIEVRE